MSEAAAIATRSKVPTETLISAYERLGSVKRVAAEVGLCPQSVHQRLQKIGKMRHVNVFTEVEIDRLRQEYWIAAETGKLAELAVDMGRTKHFLCRQARTLGLTKKNRERPYNATWKNVGEESARIIFEQFKSCSLNVGQFCAKRNYGKSGFTACMLRHFPDEWEHVMESKQIKQTKYRYGRQFEYKARDDLKSKGYFALRSPASRSPIDVLSVKFGTVLFVQCKRSGALPPGEWNELFDLAQSCGAIPLLADCKTGRGITYRRLLARKDGSRKQQPFEVFQP